MCGYCEIKIPKIACIGSMIRCLLVSLLALLVSVNAAFPDDFCQQQSTLVLSIITVAVIIISVVMIFFGFKVIKPILFAIGFTVGFGGTYIVIETYIAPDWIIWGKIGVSAGVGVILGALCGFLTKVASFGMGALVGTLVSSLILATPLGPSLFNTKNYLPLIAVGISGIAGGAVSFLLKDYVIMFACALTGSAAIAFSIDCAWLHTDFFMLIPNIISLRQFQIRPDNYATYLLLGGIVVCTIGGFIFQLYLRYRKKHPAPSHHHYEMIRQ